VRKAATRRRVEKRSSKTRPQRHGCWRTRRAPEQGRRKLMEEQKKYAKKIGEEKIGFGGEKAEVVKDNL